MPVDRQGYKKKYLLRRITDKEADERIREANYGEEEESVEVPEVRRVDKTNDV